MANIKTVINSDGFIDFDWSKHKFMDNTKYSDKSDKPCFWCGENARYSYSESAQGGEICQEKYWCEDCHLHTSVEVECPDSEGE